MPKKLPPHVEKNLVKGHAYLSFRIGKGPRIRLPDDPNSPEFRQAYAAAMAGETYDTSPTLKRDGPGTIGALIVSYKTTGIRLLAAVLFDPGTFSAQFFILPPSLSSSDGFDRQCAQRPLAQFTGDTPAPRITAKVT
jgi:hypothetical protein